jgi:hypothetical protein
MFGETPGGAAGRSPRVLPECFMTIREMFEQLTVPDDAAGGQDAVMALLKKHGYVCSSEFPIADRGDGRRGYIDVYAARDGVRLAIEIDNRSPRKKSIVKLNRLPHATRIILLRGLRKTHGGNPVNLPGIEVICLKTC